MLVYWLKLKDGFSIDQPPKFSDTFIRDFIYRNDLTLKTEQTMEKVSEEFSIIMINVKLIM